MAKFQPFPCCNKLKRIKYYESVKIIINSVRSIQTLPFILYSRCHQQLKCKRSLYSILTIASILITSVNLVPRTRQITQLVTQLGYYITCALGWAQYSRVREQQRVEYSIVQNRDVAWVRWLGATSIGGHIQSKLKYTLLQKHDFRVLKILYSTSILQNLKTKFNIHFYF